MSMICRDELQSIKDSIECCLLQQVRKGDVDIDALETWCKAVVKRINAALATPRRNCDIYTTSGEADRAITEYCSKMAETGECVKSCPYRESEGGCAFGWILAAAGTKGEADGSK